MVDVAKDTAVLLGRGRPVALSSAVTVNARDGGRGHSPRASTPNRSWSIACTSASA
jgi:hypothetical protein